MTVKQRNQSDLAGWIGHTLVDQNGDKIGKVVDLYMDEATGQPEWIAVNTGRFGSNISFVPLAGATQHGDDLKVSYTTDVVKESPNAEPDGQLTQDEEARLYAHYGMDYSEDRSSTGLPQTARKPRAGQTGTKGRDTSGPTTDDAMTRSEEVRKERIDTDGDVSRKR